MTVKKKIRRKKTVTLQNQANERASFDQLCMAWRPIFDQCLSLEGDEVFGKIIADTIVKRMKQLGDSVDPATLAGTLGFAVQSLLTAYAHLMNCVDASNPGMKRRLLREYLNSIHERPSPVEGLPAGE